MSAKGQAEFFKSCHPIGAAKEHGEIAGFAVGAGSLRFQGVQDEIEGSMLDLGVECD